MLFESDRNGDWQIFGQQLGDKDGEALARGSKWDVMPQASPDGKWILYLHDPRFLPSIGAQASKRVWTLMRIPASGGRPQPVTGGEATEEFQCAAPGGSRCVLRTDENGRFVFYALDPIRGKGRELARIPASRGIFGDWSVSPDGRFAAIPDHDSFPPKFRIVDLDHPEHRETELAIGGIPTLDSVTWATGRPGWYIAVDLFAGLEIRYVDQQGHSRRLWETAGPTWAVPSADGRHMALVDGAIDSNVWMVDR